MKYFMFELFAIVSAKDSFRIELLSLTIPPKLPNVRYRHLGVFSAKVDFYNKRYARINISTFGFNFSFKIYNQ